MCHSLDQIEYRHLVADWADQGEAVGSEDDIPLMIRSPKKIRELNIFYSGNVAAHQKSTNLEIFHRCSLKRPTSARVILFSSRRKQFCFLLKSRLFFLQRKKKVCLHSARQNIVA